MLGFLRGFDNTPHVKWARGSGGVAADVRGVHLVYHNGANPGFRAAIVLAPSAGAGVVVLTNGESDRFTEGAARSLLEQLLR